MFSSTSGVIVTVLVILTVGVTWKIVVPVIVGGVVVRVAVGVIELAGAGVSLNSPPPAGVAEIILVLLIGVAGVTEWVLVSGAGLTILVISGAPETHWGWLAWPSLVNCLGGLPSRLMIYKFPLYVKSSASPCGDQLNSGS